MNADAVDSVKMTCPPDVMSVRRGACAAVAVAFDAAGDQRGD